MIILFALSLCFSGYATTLDDALVSALNKNESVKQSAERVVQQKEKLSQAKSGPQPNLSFQATHIIQPELANPAYRAFSPAQQTTTQLTLMQPLFRGFREFAALRQQRDLLESAQSTHEGVLAKVYEDVATAYFQVLALEQDLRNLEDQRRIYSERVKNLQIRARRGEAARNEPLSAQSAEAVVEAEIEVVKANLRKARETFTYLTGVTSNAELVDDKSEGPLPAEVGELRNYLDRISERPDIRAAQKSVEASEETVSIAKGGHWPTLDVTGNYYFQRPGFAEEIDWDVQFKLIFPIYEGGLKVSQTREATSVKRTSDLELQRLRRLADSEIRSLHESLVIRVKHLNALKRATDLSRLNSQQLERDFRRGLARNIDVQSALAEYGVARRNYDQARYAARLDWIRLQRAANLLPEVVKKSKS